MRKAIMFNEFTPVPTDCENGALLPDKDSADGLCKAINNFSTGWRVEETTLAGRSYWKVVWLLPSHRVMRTRSRGHGFTSLASWE